MNHLVLRWRSLWLLAALLALTAPLAPPLAAQEPTRTVSDDEVNKIAKEVYCPVCESTPLDVCETQACADWRELIRTKLAAGETPQEIFAYFAEQYGDRVLATPPARGLSLLLWIWPFVALIGGAAIFGRYMLNMRRAAAESKGAMPETAVAHPVPPAKDPYVTRIEQELKGE